MYENMVQKSGPDSELSGLALPARFQVYSLATLEAHSQPLSLFHPGLYMALMILSL